MMTTRRINLMNKGEEYEIAFSRASEGMWKIRINGVYLATGKRLEQNSWSVSLGEEVYKGRTLADAISTAFYGWVK